MTINLGNKHLPMLIIYLLRRALPVFLVTALFPLLSTAQAGVPFMYGDPLPDAPALAPRGSYTVGVRTIQLINNNQPDILKAKDGTAPLYNRSLTLEIWYPAVAEESKKTMTTYADMLGSRADSTRPLHPFTFSGRSLRDATPLRKDGPFPLVIVS